MRRTWAVLAIGLVLWCAAPANAAAPSLGIDVISNRADIISAGDALVAVNVPAGVSVSRGPRVRRRRDVTSAFAVRPNGRFEGLVTGLSLGPNVITARAPGRQGRTRHDHQPPQRRAGLLRARRSSRGSASRRPRDSQCNQPPTYEYQYQNTTRARSRDYDPATRRPTSPTPPRTRARPSRTSCASRPATRTATSTRSPSCTTRRSRGRRGTRSRSGTTSS